jgi:toxin ParE1/3/4
LKGRVRKSVLAELDLIEIWQYTFENWGPEQADLYLDELDQGIARLVSDKNLGIDRSEVRAGYRALLINSHAVYYVITGADILIVRVLHGRMDSAARLKH